MERKALPSKRNNRPPTFVDHPPPANGDAPVPSVEPVSPANVRNLAIIREAQAKPVGSVFSRAELGLTMPRIAVDQSVRTTLESNPQILLQDTEVETREGQERVAVSAFDTRVQSRLQTEQRQRSREEISRNPPPPTASSATPTPTPSPLVRRTSLNEFELGLRQKLANGIVLEPKVAFRPNLDEEDLVGFNNSNEGTIAFGVFIPIAKRGGTVVNLAPEISARFDLLASVLQLRFITSQSVKNTIQAYWRCRAAEDRYKLSLESEDISLRLVNLTTSLVEAEEIAAAQLPQILADRNTTAATRMRAETELILSRQRLAIAMGLNPDALAAAPLTSDPFPDPPKNANFPTVKDLSTVALSLRDDLRAARQLENSRKVLLDAAYLELRPRLDLQLSATYIPFETRTTASTAQGGEFRGLAALSLDWPIQNNEAIGNLIQSEASYDRSRINVTDLQRSIVSGVISSLTELRSAAAEVARYAEAARFNAQALAAQEELFRLGQANLTDTITSRQRLVQSQLEFINARERYAISLVQLRFESGMLLFSDEGGDWIDQAVWQSIPLSHAPND